MASEVGEAEVTGSMTKQVPWFRVLVEGVVIVVSILLAFGIDAWWDRAVERREVQEELENVYAEFESNLSSVDYQIHLLERVRVASEHVADEIRESSGGALSLPDSLVWLVSIFPTIDPSLGAVDALVNSGRLAAIEDPALRSVLAGLRGRFDDAIEGQLTAKDLYFEQLYPQVDESVPMDGWDWIGIDFFSKRRIGEPLPHRGHLAFPTDSAVAHAIVFRSYLYGIVIDELTVLQRELRLGLDLMGA